LFLLIKWFFICYSVQPAYL